MRSLLTASAGAALLLAGAGICAGAYTITDLGTLGGPGVSTGPGSEAYGISGAGVVVGLSVLTDLGPDTKAFRWNGGTMVTLEPLAGDQHSAAFAICSGGMIVGQSFNVGGLSGRGVMWDASGVPTLLGDFEPRDVNCAGTVVGRRILMPGAAESQAVVYQGGVLTDIPTLGGASNEAHAINSLGDVVGSSATAGGAIHAFLLPGTGGAVVDLGTLGGASSYATGTNGARQVVGFSETAGGDWRGYIVQIGPTDQVVSRTELPALSAGGQSYARAINGLGVVVGTSDSHAVMWDGGVITDLNGLLPAESGWQLRVATAINDDGDIVGLGRYHGLGRAFLLRAAPPPPCVGDVNGDGATDVYDFGILARNFGTFGHAPYQDGDLDGDGDVDVHDFGIFAPAFGCKP